MEKFQRENSAGEIEYQDAEGIWMGERDVCRHCSDQQEENGKPYRFAEEQYSFGYYAGRYCAKCWPKSGYRDATDQYAQFDESDAGESLHGEEW